ncbi:hypothetical protein FRC03_011967 [Tulasnella sp. 419]|nr:hypothetical protein FRC03_011967 [Tulasnella sp. 419]
MSNSLYSELRPLFRLLEDPYINPTETQVTRHRGDHHRQDQGQSLTQFLRQPAIDVSEDEHGYIIEAELPGIRKENIDVSVGDNGRSITIEGKDYRSERTEEQLGQQQQQGDANQKQAAGSNEQSVQRRRSGPRLVSSERINRTSFRRTVFLSRPVDGKRVSAKLDHGILTLDVPKVEDKESIRVSIQ